MSPSEFQLRQALHDGEGDPVNPDRLIAHAIGVRRERRHKINTIVAGGAAVAVVGLCASAAIAFGGGNDSGAGSSAAYGRRADRAAATSADVAAPAGGASTQASARSTSAASGSAPAASTAGGTGNVPSASCPKVPDRYLLPGGGGLGKFGSSEPLFSQRVTSLRLCGYPLRAAADRTTAVLHGAAARSVITALNSSPSRKPSSKPCPANIDYVAGTVELIGATSNGRTTTPVVVTLGCVVSQATNGSAVRYLGDVPDVLAQMVVPIPLKSTAGVPGKITVSPVR